MDAIPQPREQLARILEQRIEIIINDAIGVFPFAGIETLETDRGSELGALLLQLLVSATRDGELDSRSGRVADLQRLSTENGLSIGQLFSFAYLIERASLDELALDDSFGANAEPWPAVAQMVRRASFDVLAALADRINRDPGARALSDPLTSLYTRAVLLAALEKEIQRSERFGHPFALIVLDVDHLTNINHLHGYGFGDRLLERIGILITNYFREQDWVSRYDEDGFAVLLPETHRADAEMLAERLRVTVQERLALRDHVTEQQVGVTVSVALVVADSVDTTVRASDLLREAEQALRRAKDGGRNRLESVDVNVTKPAAPRRARSQAI